MGLREGTLERLPVEAREYITTLEQETKDLRVAEENLRIENTILNERLNLLLYRRLMINMWKMFVADVPRAGTCVFKTR